MQMDVLYVNRLCGEKVTSNNFKSRLYIWSTLVVSGTQHMVLQVRLVVWAISNTGKFQT